MRFILAVLTVLLVWGPTQTEATEDPQFKALRTQEQQLTQRLLRDFPESEKPLVLLGDFYQNRGKTDQALKVWQQVLKKNARRADIYDRMAKVAFATDDYKTSSRLWRTAIQINPSLPSLHNNLARSLMQLGQYPEAQQLLEKEIRLSGDNVPSYLLLGGVHLELRQYKDAERCYQKVLEIDPNSHHACYGLYQVYSRLKDRKTAAKYLKQFQQGKSQWRETKKETVVRNLSQADSEAGFYGRCLAKLCADARKLYLAKGDRQTTEWLLTQAIELDPNSVALHAALTSFYVDAGRVQEALEVCRFIKQLDPNNLSCQLNLGLLAARLGQFEQAEKALRTAIAMAPTQAAGYRELAQLYLRAKTKQVEACDLAAQAVKLEPVASHYFLLGWAYDVTGDRARGLEALQRAVALDPQNQAYQQVLQQKTTKETRP
ncbi:MAG: tetratricopeptide repeat protein [Planctomycetes bacterium]|nr:tetratricopeptide repeat protein [Planctomycetota bacterium]